MLCGELLHPRWSHELVEQEEASAWRRRWLGGDGEQATNGAVQSTVV